MTRSPISDMLTRIRNASRALLPVVEVPHSKMKESIAAHPEEGRLCRRSRGRRQAAQEDQAEAQVSGQEERDRRLAPRQHARFAPLCRLDRNPARARRPGRRGRFHFRRRDDRQRRPARRISAENCSATSGNIEGFNVMSRIGKQPIAIPAKGEGGSERPARFLSKARKAN